MVIGVCEEGLELIATFSDHEKSRVNKFLHLLRMNKSSQIYPEVAIPDDAPEKLKNEAAKQRGKFYRGGSHCEDCLENSPIHLYEWYESNDRSILYVWRVKLGEM